MCLVYGLMGQRSNIVYAVLITIIAPNMAMVAVCGALSSGMPLLYFAGFVFVTVIYVVSKYLVFKRSFKPNFDMKKIMIAVQVSLLAHILISYFVFEFSPYPLVPFVFFVLKVNCSFSSTCCKRKKAHPIG
jgi:hypothetical protein